MKQLIVPLFGINQSTLSPVLKMRNKLRVLLYFIFLLVIQCKPPKASNKDHLAQEKFIDRINLSELNGDPIDLYQYNQKVLIVNLWATWCRPCLKEMPDFVEMMTLLPNDDFELILASDEDIGLIQEFIKRRPLDLHFTMLGTSLEALGAYSLPATLIINKNGELAKTIIGSREWNSDEMISMLKKIETTNSIN